MNNQKLSKKLTIEEIIKILNNYEDENIDLNFFIQDLLTGNKQIPHVFDSNFLLKLYDIYKKDYENNFNNHKGQTSSWRTLTLIAVNNVNFSIILDILNKLYNDYILEDIGKRKDALRHYILTIITKYNRFIFSVLKDDKIVSFDELDLLIKLFAPNFITPRGFPKLTKVVFNHPNYNMENYLESFCKV